MSGFIKFHREEPANDLIAEDHLSFVLLSVIALRARRKPYLNLEIGEAYIGDYKNYGMTEQQYRTRKKRLEKWEFITTRATGRGTIAKLIDKRIYDINEDEGNGQSNGKPTDKQRTANGKLTTNKKEIKKKEIKKEVIATIEQNWKDFAHALKEKNDYYYRLHEKYKQKGYDDKVIDEVLEEFILYWHEILIETGEQRWRDQKTFAIGRRLATWFKFHKKMGGDTRTDDIPF